MQQQHAAYYLELAEDAAPALNGPQQQHWLARLTQEQANLRAALVWAQESGADALLIRLVSALQWFWRLRNYWSEGLHWAAIVEERAAGQEALLHAKAYYVAGAWAYRVGDWLRARRLLETSWSTWPADSEEFGGATILNELSSVLAEQGEYQRARELLEMRLAYAQEHQDIDGITDAFGALGDVALYQGDLAQAEHYYSVCKERCEQRGDLNGLAVLTYFLGLIALYQDQIARAVQWAEQSCAHAEAAGNPDRAVFAQGLLGLIALRQDRLEQAVASLRDWLHLFVKNENRDGSAFILDHLAAAALRLGYAAQAAEWLGAAAAARSVTGAVVPAYRQAEWAVVCAQSREQIGAAAWAQVWATGQQRQLMDVAADAYKWAATIVELA